jgi:hypothetical protein
VILTKVQLIYHQFDCLFTSAPPKLLLRTRISRKLTSNEFIG